MCKKMVYSISIILLLGLVMPAFGQQLALVNGDFEAQAIADGGWAEGVATGWTTVGSSGAQNLAAGALSPPAQSGQNICFLNQGGSLYQSVQEEGNPVLVEANKSYKVSVWVARRGGTEGTFGGILEVFLQESGALARIDTATYDLQNPKQPRNSWTYQTFYLTTGPNPPGLGNQLQVGLANVSTRAPANQFWFAQIDIDDVSIMSIPPIAINPSPANESLAEGTTVNLQWQPGPLATQHDVYLGENLDDVNNATISTPVVYKGRQDSNNIVVTDLIPGATYYWRIDEISGTNIWRGEIWKFDVPQPIAFNPIPSDGAKFVDINVVLGWTPGTLAIHHNVYIGSDRDEVLNGTGRTYKGAVDVNAFNPGPLAYETAYYWRINEDDGAAIHDGDIWTFTTAPELVVTPDLVAWWRLDEGEGRNVFDWSGHGNHAKIIGSPQWVVGQVDSALSFSGGYDEYVDCGNAASLNITDAITISAWINTNDAGNSEDNPYVTKGNNSYALRHDAGNSIGFYIYAGGSPFLVLSAVTSAFNDAWHHIAGTYDGSNMTLYINGESMANTAHTGPIDISAFNVNIGSDAAQTWMWYNGLIDDVRIYNRGLTRQEVQQVMLAKSEFATRPSPANGSRPDIEHFTSLSWLPGGKAAQHDVYFGTDADTVAGAQTSDTTGIYRGRQDPNTYTPPEPLQAGQTYYWRIDEFNTDATISIGRLWSFTISEYLIVDDFESYNDIDNRIFDVWGDYFVNNTGMTVGYFDPPFAEQNIIHGGSQAMYMHYDNDGTVNEGTGYEQRGTLLYSEAEREWANPQDWTRRNVNGLVLWFRGIPASVGSLTATASGYRMTAAGLDIWDVADQLHFAYKQFSGNGTVTARVVSISNTNSWAKAGVMIRESLDPGSAHAMMAVTPGNGVTFQNRPSLDTASATVNTQAGIAAPRWVRLTRSGNSFTARYSSNGTIWTTLGTAEITMGANVYIGLCLTSRNVNATCTAEFSNVTLPASATGQWESRDIGISSNMAEQLYVVVQDNANKNAVVKHPDSAATTFSTWTQWNIPLTDFAGVNLQAVTSLVIGVGDRDNPQQGSAGDLYIDDIGLRLP
jgi:regulation of enolase protein 1 (concanavalin A-like superfamily)